MGAYQSLFQKTPEQAGIVLSPAKSDWVTGHADLTGLAVVEVERFWSRFKQLGCDKNGNLQPATLERSDLSQDLFIKNIIANLPKEKDGSVSFLVFLKFVQWTEIATEEMKLRVIFNFLNNGKELDLYVLEKLFKRLYPTASDDQIRATCELMLEQMDDKKTGYINENQFVAHTRRLYPAFQLNEVLKFDLIPNEALSEANLQQSASLGASMMNMRRRSSPASVELSDTVIESIANKIINKDWERLALKLGFLEYDIEAFRAKNRGNSFNSIVDLLVQWRDQDPYQATKSRLRTYLEDSNMNEAAMLCY